MDEATLLPDSLLHTLLDRLSTPGARAVLTCNPAHPHHEVKRRYIDEPRESEVAFGFSLDDNPILDEEYKASLASRGTWVVSTAGWCSASGPRWRDRYGRAS